MRCDGPILASVFNGRDNIISLVLIADGGPLVDLSGVTRVVVDMDGGTTLVDSDVVGGALWWSEQESYRGELIDVLRMQLGGQSLPAGTYDDVGIVIYDSTYPNGLRVENSIKLTVFA